MRWKLHDPTGTIVHPSKLLKIASHNIWELLTNDKSRQVLFTDLVLCSCLFRVINLGSNSFVPINIFGWLGSLLKNFMGLALVHFQKYWLLKDVVYGCPIRDIFDRGRWNALCELWTRAAHYERNAKCFQKKKKHLRRAWKFHHLIHTKGI